MRALVVSSRQSKHTTANEPWFRRSVEAVDALASSGHTLVCSVGMRTWEAVLWRAAVAKAPVELVYPLGCSESEEQARAWVERHFGLRPDRCQWHFVRSTRRLGKLKDTWQQRDELAWKLAQLVVPVSVRPKGRVATYLEQVPRGRQVLDFSACYKPKASHARWTERLPKTAPDSPRWLMHLTRACDGPWPGEQTCEYFADLWAQTEGDPRDGFHTLQRIVTEGRLRASNHRIRGGHAMVCWTWATVQEALELVRWRARYARYAFEPYAVALTMQAAHALGARPIVHDEGAQRQRGSHDQEAFRQGRGAGSFDAEREWRSPGDVLLDALNPDDVRVWTATDEEAVQLSRRLGIRVESLGCLERAD